MKSEAIDAVFGFDVDRFAVRVGQDAPYRSRHHAMAIGIAKNHHAAADTGIADEQALIHPTKASRGAMPSMIAYFARRDVDHGDGGEPLKSNLNAIAWRI